MKRKHFLKILLSDKIANASPERKQWKVKQQKV